MLSDPFCVVFEVCVWIIVRLEDPNMAHYTISNRVSHLFIFFICWYLIKSMMACIKNTAVYLIVHMGYFLSRCAPNPSLSVCC